MALYSGGGGTGGNREVNYILWDTPRTGHILQVSWEIPLGSGWLLASGGPQPSEGMEEVDVAVSGAEQGGCGCPDLGIDLCGKSSGSHNLWVGYVGN